MGWLDSSRKILGMNARNLLYIDEYNSRAHKRFADDKLFTKQYLSSRGIGVAKLYGVIKTPGELRVFNPDSLPKTFVIKPNRGFGGEGIIVIDDRQGGIFIDAAGERHTWQELSLHMVSILEGKYSISGIRDQALLEERLLPAEFLSPYITKGLPDIRIIVFKLVPVIAMLRLPTRDSHGKANLHMGALGVGLDIATGRASFAVSKGQFVTALPSGLPVKDIKMKQWDEVLMTAIQAAHLSKIGFVAVDIVATSTGVKILELNARPGLSVQIANQIPLRQRLEQISDSKVNTPEQGLSICRALFGSGRTTTGKPAAAKTIISPYEDVLLLSEPEQMIRARIDPAAEKNTISTRYLGAKTNEHITVKLKGKRLVLPVAVTEFSTDTAYDLIVAGKFLTDFLIDPSLKLEERQIVSDLHHVTSERNERILRSIDKRLGVIDRSLHVLRALRPLNAKQAKEMFFANPDSSPIFAYAPAPANLPKLEKELFTLPSVPDHPLRLLYTNKIAALKTAIELIKYHDSERLTELSSTLFGPISAEIYQAACRSYEETIIHEDHSELLTTSNIVKYLEEFFANRNLTQWKVMVSEHCTADIAVSKKRSVILKAGVSFTANRLRSVIMHEIMTHAYRFENGERQKYGLFALGTAGYLATEEGLAIYNQKKLGVPLGERDVVPPLHCIAAYLGLEHSFAEVFALLKTIYGVSDELAWKVCLRSKRGLTNTAAPVVCMRDTAYYRGYRAVKKYIDATGESGLKQLYIGKISLEDIPSLENLSLEAPTLLPNFS